MSDISRVLTALEEDFKSADKLVDDIYNKYFARFFQKETEMYQRFKDTDKVITDKELEWLITSLPLELFSVANALSQFKQHNEIVKLKIKQRKNKGESDDGLDEEYKIMSIIYASVITRVEQEISFSKELIMGAKKIWDSRRSGEQTPIRPAIPVQELPDYQLHNDAKLDF